MMEQPVGKWGNDLDKAKEEARRSDKLVLIFFHSSQCSGCKATIEKTLPDPKVSKYVDKNFVPVSFEVSDPRSRALMKQYGFEWTPTFIVADDSGGEVYRWVGYLPPRDFCAQMVFAEGRTAFKNKNWDRAAKCYGEVSSRFHDSELAPEALYYAGVAMYEKGHDVSSLKNANGQLQARYPKSSWARKSSVWGA